MKISAIIPTGNEICNIEAAMDSVSIVDEILVPILMLSYLN
jgi:hypothetical protein